MTTASNAAGQLELARVAVQHVDLALPSARARTPSAASACRACSGAGSARRARPAGTRAGACGTSTARAAAPAGSRGRSASSAAPSAPRARARRAARRRARTRRRASGSAAGRRARCGANQRAHVRRSRRPASPSPRSNRASASRSSCSSTNGLCAPVFTRISRQLNAAMSTPAESSPLSSAWTSVVPEPANGSSTRPRAGTWRRKSSSTSCGMYLPRYGCRRWTCFVRTRSGRSRSDHDRSRSRPCVDLLLGERHGRRVRRGGRGSLERVRQVLDPAGALGDHVEAHVEPCELLVAREPGPAARRTRAHLLRASPSPAGRRTRRRSSTSPRRRRDAAPARDHVELGAGEPAVRVEDPVAAQPVPARGAALGAFVAEAPSSRR